MAPSVSLQTVPTRQFTGQFARSWLVQASSPQASDPVWQMLLTQLGKGHPRLSGAYRIRLPLDAAKKSQVAAPTALVQSMGVARDVTVAPNRQRKTNGI